MAVNENYAYEVTEKISFPRLVGTEGEMKAREMVAKEFEKIGYKPIREKFMTSFHNWVVAQYAFIPIGLILLLMALTLYFSLPLITLAIIAAILIIGWIANKTILGGTSIALFKDPEKNFETENIYGKLKSKNSKGTIIFMAHWDSKSQTFNSAIRVFIFVVVIFSALIISFAFLVISILMLLGISNQALNLAMLIYTIIVAAFGVLNYFNKTENKSPGATDNGASVGVTFELARYFKKNPLDNTDLIFLITGSEELNLGGAKDFINKYENKYDRSSTYFINFDGVGTAGTMRLITSYGIPKKNSSEKLNKLFRETAEELKIKINNIYLPTGAWSDYMPVVQKGFEACWLASTGAFMVVHTKKDSMDKVSKEGLKNTVLICVEAVKKIDQEF